MDDWRVVQKVFGWAVLWACVMGDELVVLLGPLLVVSWVDVMVEMWVDSVVALKAARHEEAESMSVRYTSTYI